MELLTGKCREDFLKWGKDKGITNFNPKEYALNTSRTIAHSIIIKFFDSVGLNILITVEFDFGYVITENKYEEIEEVKKWYETREEAQLEAIKKANEIYNKNN